jgi:uncharacterized membrane protein YphA (DoxX/SURF4 family)
MNILLWVLQVALAFFCIAGGTYKISHFAQLQEMNASMRALPQVFWTCVGALEALAGLGLILPGATRILPILTAYSAVFVAVESVLITAVYLYYRDFPPTAYTAMGAILAAFIAYGRFALKPF